MENADKPVVRARCQERFVCAVFVLVTCSVFLNGCFRLFTTFHGGPDSEVDSDSDIDDVTNDADDTDANANDADQELEDCGDEEVMDLFETCRASTDESSCVESGGTWTQWGIGPDHICQCPTGQEGCPCSRPSGCLSNCIANDVDSCDSLTRGQCAPLSPLVCDCEFDENGNPRDCPIP